MGPVTESTNKSRHYCYSRLRYFSILLINMVKVFNCAVTGEEISTDAYKIEETEFFLIIHGKAIEDTIGDIDTGANASEEEAGEELEKYVKVIRPCCGAEGSMEYGRLDSKVKVKKSVLDYAQKLLNKDGALNEGIKEKFGDAAVEKFNASREEFARLGSEKLPAEETAMYAEKKAGKKITNKISKAIYDEFVAPMDNENFNLFYCAEDYDQTGVPAAVTCNDPPAVGDPIRMVIFQHGVIEVKY